ncbi:MAG: Xaa-Pro aminopeptidase [Bacteroidetes bacterium ADurb.Bin145]|nr:MAG: Xaa-Pro aminopeptidase [Bacteroidetes bacterium ADurb.Bin145]
MNNQLNIRMKRFNICLLALVFIASFNSGCQRQGSTVRQPDTSDLIMDEEAREVFSLRRETILETIDDGLLIMRSDYGFNGGRHGYRVASNFWYLTGYGLPGAIMSLSDKESGISPAGYALYLRQRSIRDVIYSGNLPDPVEIASTWSPDAILDYNEADRVITDAVRAGRSVFVDFSDNVFRDRVQDIIAAEKADRGLLRDINPTLSTMRVNKDEYEVRMLQRAIDITGWGIEAVMAECAPGMYEFEIEAILEYTWRRSGSSMPGFGSIVGSGDNAVTLHYSANNRKMEDGDLLLMDVAAEYGYYTADITRTIPVNGRFTKEQKDIYSLVLRAQKAAIEEMKPGAPMTAAHRAATNVIIDGLHDLGLVTDPNCQWQRKFYTIYHICHFLGLNAHDPGSQGIPESMMSTYLVADTAVGRPLEEGMVLTVEPGIYLRANGLDQLEMLYGSEAEEGEIADFIEKVRPVYERYSNIGVRIEDDVLITGSGNVVMSASIPKEPDEIEKRMQSR